MAFELDQIKGFLDAVLDVEDKTKKEDIPEYSAIYKEAVKRYNDVRPHAERGHFPEKLFKESAPNESQEEFKYRKSIFKNITVPYWKRARSTVNRIWNRANFSINWKEESSTVTQNNPPKKYFEEKFPGYNSLISYFEQVVTDAKLKDPNAVITFKPRNIMFDRKKGQFVVDESDVREPIPVIYYSPNVILYKPNKLAFVELHENTTLENGKKGRIFEVYDDTNIWKIYQVGKKHENRFKIFKYYKHGLGYLPVNKLRGEPQQIDSDSIYASYFEPALPNLDLALRDSSTLQMVKYNIAYPQRWEFVDPCDECRGTGWIQDVDSDEEYQICQSCNGTGNIDKHSPMKTIEIQAGDRLDEGDEGVSIPPVGFASPDSEILDFLRDEIREQIEKGFAFLNIDVSSSNVKGSEDTALGKKIDREELFEFLRIISNEAFDLLRFSIKTIGYMRYSKDIFEEEIPSVNEPVDFGIRSLEEITQEMNEAREKKLPMIAMRKLLKEYVQTRFNMDAEAKKIVDLIMMTDRLFMLTNKEIAVKLNTGTVAKWEDILHTSIQTFIDEAIEEDSDFLDKEITEQKEILMKKARAKVGELQEGTGTADDIINQGEQ